MTSRAEKKRRKHAQTVAKAHEPKPDAPPPVVNTGKSERPEDRDGLVWLVRKKRISNRRYLAGLEYRKAYREPPAGAMKSCLADTIPGSGGGHPPDYNAASLDAQRRLFSLRFVALSGHTEMIELMDGVAGGGQTLISISGGDHIKARRIEPVLGVAMDLIAQYLEAESVAATTACNFQKCG